MSVHQASPPLRKPLAPDTPAASQPIPKKSQQIKTDKPRPHICTICTRAFARLEHLKRHERSHTNEKPFQCAVCGRCFARRDLVLRHQQKLHTALASRRSSDVLAGATPGENIIVLLNNTAAKAPLPLGLAPPALELPAQLMSPPRSSELALLRPGRKRLAPHFRTALFNHVNLLPLELDDFRDKKLFPRHASFSAVSSSSYLPRDAIPVIDEGAPDFDLGLDLDWNSIGSLDLSAPDHAPGAGLMALQFQNPHHPHHIKGTTPLGLGVLPPNAAADVDAAPQHPEFRLDSRAIKKRKPSDHQFSPLNHESISDAGDWLHDIVNTPYESSFNFLNAASPANSPKHLDDISNLFKSRQLDLLKQYEGELNGLGPSPASLEHQLAAAKQEPLGHLDLNANTFAIDIGQKPKEDPPDMPVSTRDISLITEEVRNRIILISNLTNLQFPPLEDLNNYIRLYEKEFNKYFPFVHLPSLKNPMVDNFENIPLLLSMASIGALYSYHDSNTLLLFNLSKFHIQNFFEKEVSLDNLQFKKVPLMAHQCLVLHIFISMFLNEPNMIDITSRQMKSMVGLVKSTNFNKPLNNFLVPPTSVDLKHDDNNSSLIQNNFDYFIMSQSRIRTLFVFYMLQVFRTSLLDMPISLFGASINSGTQCLNENLWKAENPTEWYHILKRTHPEQRIDLVALSNNSQMKDLIYQLETNDVNNRLSMNNLLSMLIVVHEKIQSEFLKYKSPSNSNNGHQPQINEVKNFNYINWRLVSRSYLVNLIKVWEMNFIRNGGVLAINDANMHLLKETNELKLILPLYHLAQIKISINLSPIMEKVVYKDWEKFNMFLNALDTDFEGLKESINSSIEIMNLWNYNINLVNDAKKTSLRTPVFFVTCVFVSLMLISQFLYFIEQTNELDTKRFGITERILWLKCEKIFKDCEKSLSMNYLNNSIMNSKNEDYENYESIRKLIENNSNSKLIVNSIKLIKLSNKCLFLGVRILADAPIWPLAMGFAEALKNRANYISKT